MLPALLSVVHRLTLYCLWTWEFELASWLGDIHTVLCGYLQGGLKFDPSNITAVSLSSTFFNYAPCLIQNAAAGAAFTAVGLNIVPQVGQQLLCDRFTTHLP